MRSIEKLWHSGGYGRDKATQEESILCDTQYCILELFEGGGELWKFTKYEWIGRQMQPCKIDLQVAGVRLGKNYSYS